MAEELPNVPLPLFGGVARSEDGARPVVKWAGGKRALLPTLLALAPAAFRTYFEPFLGGASHFLALAPQRAVLADANEDLVQLYSAIRDDVEDVMVALDRLQPHVSNERVFYELRAAPVTTLTGAERAARFIYLNKTGFNGLYRVNRRGEFNVPFGRHETPPRLYDATNLVRVSGLLRNACLELGDFEAILDRAGDGDFAYLDPPYVPLTRTANFTSYTADSFSEQDQWRLAEAVHRAVRRGCHVVLSNSDTPLVHELYGRYQLHTVFASRSINSDGSKRQKIREVAVQAVPTKAELFSGRKRASGS